MKQIDIFENRLNGIEMIISVLHRINSEAELPKNSLVLTENYSKNKNKITSYSIAVKKPDYPTGINANGKAKTSLLNIQFKTDNNGIIDSFIYCIPDKIIPLIKEESFDIAYTKKKADPFTRVTISADSDSLQPLTYFVVREVLEEYSLNSNGNSFGCCHLYEECSNAKKCLHENRLYALGCAYYHNLKSGRIFYGKNRNA